MAVVGSVAFAATTSVRSNARPASAMLAIPLHLAGDRGIFGNGFKPVARPFEEPHVAETHAPAEAVAR